MAIVEYVAAFYGFVVAYSALYLAGQWIAAKLDRWCQA